MSLLALAAVGILAIIGITSDAIDLGAGLILFGGTFLVAALTTCSQRIQFSFSSAASRRPNHHARLR